MIHPRAKRLGDMAAGTVVVTQRARLTLTPPPGMPLALAEWARSADVATLPSGLTVAVRQFLARAPGLTPASRQTLGLELLHSTLPYVSPPPPGRYRPRSCWPPSSPSGGAATSSGCGARSEFAGPRHPCRPVQHPPLTILRLLADSPQPGDPPG